MTEQQHTRNLFQGVSKFAIPVLKLHEPFQDHGSHIQYAVWLPMDRMFTQNEFSSKWKGNWWCFNLLLWQTFWINSSSRLGHEGTD